MVKITPIQSMVLGPASLTFLFCQYLYGTNEVLPALIVQVMRITARFSSFEREVLTSPL